MKPREGLEKETIVVRQNFDVMKFKRAKWYGFTVILSIFLHTVLLFSSSWAGEGAVGEKLNSNNEQPILFLGKIEPVLAQESEAETELNVIVYIQNPDLSAVSEGIKATYSQALNSYAEQIQTIERKYRPKISLSPDQERTFISEQGLEAAPEDQAQLEALRENFDMHLDDMKREIGVSMAEAVQPNQEEVAGFITSHRGVVTSRVAVISAIGATIPSELLIPLADHPLVLSVMQDRPTELELNVSMPSARYEAWWNDSITGGIWDFGVVDTGVQENHPAFSGITFYTNAASGVDPVGHGTHVTGIAASGNTTYRGGAYGLESVIWSIAGGVQSDVFNQMEWQVTGPAQQPEVINHSLGYGVADTTDYNANDAFYDAFIDHYVIMVSKSTGNSGWNDSNPTITHPATSYNLLAVANMDDQNTIIRSDDVRRASSSVGPTFGGRKKPDITAPGTAIMSCNNSWAGLFIPDFVSMSGTSMAAPHVAGAIVLMEDGGNRSPMAQKAVLINTADAWTSNDTSTTSDDGPVDGSHWDKSYGWGYLDMWEAHFNRADYFADSVVPNNDNATPDDYKLYKGRMYRYEKATLVWHKRAAYVTGAPPTTQHALSDLNIRLFDEADNNLEDLDLDFNDNVHQVAYTAATGPLDAVIKVYAWSDSFAGAASEPFVLATEENFAEAAPPAFAVSLVMPAGVAANAQFTLTADVTNNGEVASHDNEVTLSLPPGFSIVSGSNPQDIGVIQEAATGQGSWTVRASGMPGTYQLSASNSSDSYLEIYTGASSPTSITVAGCPLPTADFTASTTSGCGPLMVNFTDSSTNSPTAWSWDFGDGVTSTLQNPSHNYTSPGTYTVTLTSTNACGSDVETKSGYITVTPAPVADFTASPTGGMTPLTVNFSDQSTNSPTAWLWDFGDGGTSTLQNPSHTYSSASTYTVTLTASNACGSDGETKAGYIVVGAAATADITVTDSVAPINDLQVPFGTITVGGNSDQTVTVTNDGGAVLNVGNIAQADPLAGPFSILNDTCSGTSVAPSASCTLTVRFAPTAASASNDTFDIPSNDPDENPVTMSISGTGTLVLQPDITVTDAIAPNDDLQVPFGNITTGSNSDQTVTLTNDGGAVLNVGNIAQADPIAGPFSILNDTCSGTSVAPSASCTLTIRFAPTADGASNDTFDIPSNDPDENPVTLSINGTGTTSGGGGGGGGCFINIVKVNIQ